MKRIKWKSWIKEIVVITVIFSAVTWWQTRDMLSSDGSYTLDLVTTDLVSVQGNVETLIEQGEKNLIYFFAPWCNVCALSIGSLEHISDPELNIVVVALDYQNVSEVDAFISAHNVKAPVVLGNAALKEQFKIKGYPSYYLIDEQQKVVGRSYGYSSSFGINIRNWLSS